jgi:hypothetical protein
MRQVGEDWYVVGGTRVLGAWSVLGGSEALGRWQANPTYRPPSLLLIKVLGIVADRVIGLRGDRR